MHTIDLELGNHVRRDVMLENAFAAKNALFELPLMPLASTDPPIVNGPSLLHLPYGRLPHGYHLPVVDLWGVPQREATLLKLGLERQIELLMEGCTALNGTLVKGEEGGFAACTIPSTADG